MTPLSRRTRIAAPGAALALTAALLVTATGAQGRAQGRAADHQRHTEKVPTSIGYGGAVTSVDPEASAAGLRVLKDGGNAVDAAIATAATLGVTEPYSTGIGGGGFFVYYDASSGQVHTIDGRETAPESMPHDAFIDPSTGKPYNFTPELVTSGVSVGVPGSLATWQSALDQWGTTDLGQALKPAIRVARRGFVVDPTFHQQTEENKLRFDAFTSTRRLYLPHGDAPRVGSVFRNPDLARTYRLLAKRGLRPFYRGTIGAEIVHAVHHPPKTSTTTLPIPTGFMERSDLAAYRTIDRAPTHVNYRGYDVYGMPPASSGGSTVGEALNILGQYDLSSMSTAEQLHHYLEASALSFADRGQYVGDPAYVDVPLRDLLSDTFAEERACEIGDTAIAKPTAAGDVDDYDGVCDAPAPTAEEADDTENISTTNLTVTDKWGNVAEYTLTIEQTGGSGIVVPGRGFLLNNELTDFSTVYDAKDPNRIQPGKRPRSSMSPTIVLHDGKPVLALGSPGGSTIITTVLQMLFNRIDRGMTLPEAIAAPRASQRHTATVTAEPAFIAAYGTELENVYGHDLVPSGDGLTSASDIGAATAIGIGPDGRLTAVAEPKRRGGGAAYVVTPTP
jgi:gamma-glutamyltranspeptidase/glutathione hydrolase